MADCSKKVDPVPAWQIGVFQFPPCTCPTIWYSVVMSDKLNKDTRVRMFRLNGTGVPDFLNIEVSEDQCEELTCPECGDKYLSPKIENVRMACGKDIDYLPDHDMIIEAKWDFSEWKAWAGTTK